MKIQPTITTLTVAMPSDSSRLPTPRWKRAPTALRAKSTSSAIHAINARRTAARYIGCSESSLMSAG